MAKRPASQSAARKGPAEPGYKTTGINLPLDVWELLNRVAF
jgi:hypothetical protein